MAIVLSLSALVALLLFIGWDRRRMDRPAAFQPKPFERLSDGLFKAKQTVRFSLGLALVFVALAASALFTPSHPPFKGPWSWAREVLYANFGPLGEVLFWSAVAVALLLLARFTWRHTPKRPGDRWYRD